jgi:putative PEP-CTERM system TPR-repeat lipoprotein
MIFSQRNAKRPVFINRSRRAALVVAILALLPLALNSCDFLTSDATRIERAKQLQTKGDYRTAAIELKKVLQNDPNNANARLLLGQVMLATGEVASAEKELRQAYDLGVPFDQLAVPLGQALLAQGKYDVALDELDPMMVDSEDIKIGVLVLRGDAYLATRKLPKAEQTFREVLALEPGRIDGTIGLARAAQMAGDFDGAEEHLKSALSLEPYSVSAWLAKGELEFRRKRYAQAEEAFLHAIKDGEPKISLSQEFVARNGLAEAQWRQGKSDAALGNVERLMRLAPQHPRPKYFRALIAYGAGDYETATRQLQQVLRDFPDYRPAQLLLGATHYAQGNLEQADMYLSSVLSADPSSVGARKLLAATRMREQKPNDALTTLQPAIAQDSTDKQLLGLASRAAFQAGDPEEGVLYLEQGLKVNPDNPALQLDLAAGYLTSGELDHAIEILEKLPETKEGAYRRELLLIIAYLRKRDTKDALAEGQKLLAKRPNDPGAYNLVGSVYLVAGDLSKARQHFDKALQLQPDNVAVLMNLGRLDFREGRQDTARGRFERVLEINPKNVGAMLALAQLSAIRGDQQQVAQWLERASATDPHALRPRLLLLRHYLGQHDTERAREIAAKLVEDAPQNINAQTALGIVQMAERNYRAAAESFRKAIRLAPKSADLQYNLARAELAQKNFGEAKRVLAKTIELRPDHVPATSTLAKLEMHDGKGAQALARARNLQKDEKTRAAGYVLEGDLHMMQRRFDNALIAYETAAGQENSAMIAIKSYQARRQAKMRDPVKPLIQWLNERPSDVRVRLVLAQDYQQHGLIKEAIAQYELLLGTNPNNPVALNNLAWLYHEKKDPRAIGTAERAHRLQPKNGSISDTYGWLLVQESQLERGTELLRQASQQAPNNPAIRYHLAVALAKSEAKDEARKILTDLVNSGKNFKEMAQAKKLLQEL